MAKPESSEFRNLREARAHLRKSIAARKASEHASNPEYEISTSLEVKRLLDIEKTMGSIDADRLAQIQKAEADAAAAAVSENQQSDLSNS